MPRPMVRPPSRMALLLLLALAGCTGRAPGAPAASSPPTSPPGTPVAVATPSAGAPTTPAPSIAAPSGTPVAHRPVPVPSVPPAAFLGSAGTDPVADGDPVSGELGSYTWLGAGSDAPWIVAPARRTARLAAPYQIRLEPALEPASWIVVWAPIERGGPGPIAGHARGSGGEIGFAGPDGPGPWSLRLEADFGGAGRAAWYWRLAPGR